MHTQKYRPLGRGWRRFWGSLRRGWRYPHNRRQTLPREPQNVHINNLQVVLETTFYQLVFCQEKMRIIKSI